MASFGAKYPHFSKIKTEPDDALPHLRGARSILAASSRLISP